MKKVLIIIPILLVTACVPVKITKEVEIHSGNRIDRERVEQRGYTFLKGVQPEKLRYGGENDEPVEIHY